MLAAKVAVVTIVVSSCLDVQVTNLRFICNHWYILQWYINLTGKNLLILYNKWFMTSRQIWNLGIASWIFFPNQIPCKLSIESLDCHFLITGFCSLPANIIPSLVYTTNKTREINTQGIVLIISKRYGLRAEALQRDVGVKYS